MVSIRRRVINNFLNKNKEFFNGDLIDIGGKKQASYAKIFSEVDCSIIFLNIDPKTEPDICADAENIPLENSLLDGFLLIEVVEHLKNPSRVFKEAYRVLKDSSFGVVTCPFIFHEHSQPYDYQRLTANKLSNELKNAGFEVVKIDKSGYLLSVIFDLIYGTISRNGFRGNLLSNLIKKFMDITSNFIYKLDSKFINNSVYSGTQILIKK